MGLLEFFRRRRERESALTGLSVSAEPSRQVAPVRSGGSVAPAGEAGLYAGQSGGFDLTQIGQIGALIYQAARSGSLQVHEGDPQSIDLRGTGLREEILEIMKAHGVDTYGGGAQEIDAGQIPAMQQQIMDALAQHGVDVHGMEGTGALDLDSLGGLAPGAGETSNPDPVGDASAGDSAGGDSGGGDSGGGA